MMFKLIIALFVIANGAPAQQPAHIINFNHSAFETEESCMEFIGTDEGRVAVAAFSFSARSQGLIVKFACVKAEDNTI